FTSLLLHSSSTLFPYTTLFRSFGGRLHGRGTSRPIRPGAVLLGVLGLGVVADDGNLTCEFGHRDRTGVAAAAPSPAADRWRTDRDRKSTRLNSSHVKISYAAFC